MLVTITAPYVDTSAADLCYALDLPEQPALHTLDITPDVRPDLRLRLRLLGASHQAVLDLDDTRLVETVACLPGRRPELPPGVTDESVGYGFTARVSRPAPESFATQVARLQQEYADDPYALIGVFPGSSDAVTALRTWFPASGAWIAWHTVHAYPQTGELVETETMVSMR